MKYFVCKVCRRKKGLYNCVMIDDGSGDIPESCPYNVGYKAAWKSEIHLNHKSAMEVE